MGIVNKKGKKSTLRAKQNAPFVEPVTTTDLNYQFSNQQALRRSMAINSVNFGASTSINQGFLSSLLSDNEQVFVSMVHTNSDSNIVFDCGRPVRIKTWMVNAFLTNNNAGDVQELSISYFDQSRNAWTNLDLITHSGVGTYYANLKGLNFMAQFVRIRIVTTGANIKYSQFYPMIINV